MPLPELTNVTYTYTDLLEAVSRHIYLSAEKNRTIGEIAACGDGTKFSSVQEAKDFLVCIKYTRESIDQLLGAMTYFKDLESSSTSLFWPSMLLGAAVTTGILYQANLALKKRNAEWTEAAPEVAAPAAPVAAEVAAPALPEASLVAAIQHPSLLASSLFRFAIAVVVAAVLATSLIMAAGVSVVSGGLMGAAGGLIADIIAGACFFNSEVKQSDDAKPSEEAKPTI